MSNKYEAIKLQLGGSIQEVLHFCEGKAFVMKNTQDIYYQTGEKIIEKLELGTILLKNKQTGEITLLNTNAKIEKYRIDLYTKESKLTILQKMTPSEFKTLAEIQDKFNNIPDNTYSTIEVRKVGE